MNILFTICGRAGSKGIKNKNMKQFLEYPLPYYTLSAIDLFCEQHEEHTYDIAVNTDSKELVSIVKRFYKEIVAVERKQELAGDRVGKVDVIRDTMEQMERIKKCKYDMVVDLDLTSPLRTKKDIENLIAKKCFKDYDVVFSVVESRRNPYFNMVKENGEYCEKVNQSNYVARQEAPAIYDMNASLYAYEPSFLEKGKGLFDGKCGMIKMYDTAVLDLDHQNDFVLMEVIAQYLFTEVEDFVEVYNHIPKCMSSELGEC